MIDQNYRLADRRQSLRLAIHHRSTLRIALDGASPDGELIHGVTLTDISCEGLMAADAGQLVPGARVALQIPLVGWREASVVWIAGNRAGCRFLQPLSLEELGQAAAHSERLAAECPSLAAQIAELAASHVWMEPASTEAPSRTGWERWWLAPAAVLLSLLAFGLSLLLFEQFG
jgi:hypothetical protein